MRISDWSSDVCSSDLGIDIAGSADGDEKVAVSERLVDAVHLQRHLAEPDDVRAQRTVGPTGRTEAFARQRLAPGADAATDQTARLQQLAVHVDRSEEHTSELQSLMRNSYAVFCLKKKKK